MFFKFLFFLFFVLSLHAGEDFSALLTKSTISGYAKAMYVYDDRLSPKLDQSTFGIGGKLGLQTSDWYGLSAKIAYYGTTDFGLRNSNPKQVDAYMFDVDKKPYSILGEAWIQYQNKNTILRFGRQEIDTPIVSTYDYRIIPNLFEAYTLTNKDISDTTLTFSYITRMSGLDGLVSFKDFRSMSQQTYTSLSMSDLQTVDSNGGDTLDISKISGDQAVFMLGYKYDKAFIFQAWNYYCSDVLNEFYTDISHSFSLTPTLNTSVEFQAYKVQELGKFKDFLHALKLNGSYELFGTKLSLMEKTSGISSYVALNFFTGNERTVTAFGNWGGYPEYVAIPYMFAQDNSVSALAKSKMGKINLKFDLAKIGLPNQTFSTGYSWIDLDKHILPNSDINLVNFIYKANITDTLNVRLQYELRDSANYRYGDDMLTTSIMYKF